MEQGISQENFAQFKAGGADITVVKRDITTVIAPGVEFSGVGVALGTKEAKKHGVKITKNKPEVVRLVKPGATVELFKAGQSLGKISH